MGFVERIQLPVQSFFDIIIDSIGGSKVVISPRFNAMVKDRLRKIEVEEYG